MASKTPSNTNCDKPCPLLFCDTGNALCQLTPEEKFLMYRKTKDDGDKYAKQYVQLGLARRKRSEKRHGRKTYNISLMPINERKVKLKSMGFDKYDGRKTRFSRKMSETEFEG